MTSPRMRASSAGQTSHGISVKRTLLRGTPRRARLLPVLARHCPTDPDDGAGGARPRSPDVRAAARYGVGRDAGRCAAPLAANRLPARSRIRPVPSRGRVWTCPAPCGAATRIWRSTPCAASCDPIRVPMEMLLRASCAPGASDRAGPPDRQDRGTAPVRGSTCGSEGRDG